jgi:hypothetical protein
MAEKTEKTEKRDEKWDIYDYLDHRGNVIEDWLNNELQVPERARIMRKLDALHDNGPDLSSELLSDTPSPHIKKIRVNGQVAPRLLICRGPVNITGREYTLLFGCTERDRKFVPPNALARAEENREFVIAQPLKRRKKRVFEESSETPVAE